MTKKVNKNKIKKADVNEKLDDEEIIPVTESMFKEGMELKNKVFTKQFNDELDTFFQNNINFTAVERINNKINILLKDELRLGLPKTDSISVFVAMSINFLSFYKTLQEVLKR